jgi:hypothetical protein
MDIEMHSGLATRDMNNCATQNSSREHPQSYVEESPTYLESA